MQWRGSLGHSPIIFFSCSVPLPSPACSRWPHPLFSHPHFASPSHIRSTWLLMHVQEQRRSMDIQMVKWCEILALSVRSGWPAELGQLRAIGLTSLESKVWGESLCVYKHSLKVYPAFLVYWCKIILFIINFS